ncbi:MAG: HD domain-containing protein [Actinomycetota bacterium]
MNLLGGWVRHTRSLAPRIDRTDLEAAGLDLMNRYAEPHRTYHDGRHLTEVITAIAVLAEHAQDLSAVMLAGWWHDAVYVPGADGNENSSAVIATATLAGWNADPQRAMHIGDLIRMTAQHRPGADPDAQVLSDADLAILSSHPDRYAEYTLDVRREYILMSDDVFAIGRAAILSDLVDRDSLYATPFARDHWERHARTNIAAELDRLTAS